jgi:cell division protein FtsI/penicillin-binding protein 2
VPFYRDRTLIPGYEVGGKTGTAQIWDSENGQGRWKVNLFNYSFVGYIAREADRVTRTSSSPSGSRRVARRSGVGSSRCR